MSGIVLIGDPNDGGGVVIGPGSSTVTINNRRISYVGDDVAPHPCCGEPNCPPVHCHAKTQAYPGESSVTIENKQVTLVGSYDTCGHRRSKGSTDVTLG